MRTVVSSEQTIPTMVAPDRLDMLPPVVRHQRRNQAGIPLIGLFRFAQPPLSAGLLIDIIPTDDTVAGKGLMLLRVSRGGQPREQNPGPCGAGADQGSRVQTA